MNGSFAVVLSNVGSGPEAAGQSFTTNGLFAACAVLRFAEFDARKRSFSRCKLRINAGLAVWPR